ncbi:MAG TPA: cell wall hydrolase [Devosiaceae bacterium]|nr:cell wall hydrolase [Devosiaceae bacterium]
MQHWPAAARRADAAYDTLRFMAGASLALLAYAGLTQDVLGPGYGKVLPVVAVAAAPATPVATLTFEDGRPVITGSVSHLFDALGTFVGPNEAMKQDRLRPGVDVLAMTKSFDEARTRIASLEQSNNPGAAPVPAGTVVADGVRPVSPIDVSAKIALAAVDPSLVASPTESTPALNAIDSAAQPATPPLPATLSRQLAYARDDTPMTAFPPLKTDATYSAKDLNCLAQAVYFEARGESYRGQVAVAQVVMNRLAHPLYPKTICAVVFQDAGHRDACQFSFACDGRPEVINEKQPWAQAEDIAQKVATGELYLPEVGDATHYHATYVYPDWAPRLKRVTKIGMHIFYKFRNAA